MKRYAAVVCLALMLCTAARALDAGAAKVEITPPLGTPLAGYSDRMGRGAVAVHDPVWARAAPLDDGETALFLVSLDLCIVNRELRDRVLELAPAAVPRDHIILSATHTHSAQGGMVENLVFRAVTGPFKPELLNQTAKKIAECMQAAFDKRKRATIGYGAAEQEVLSQNRRVPKGPIDRQIGVIRVDDSDGNAIAMIGNFAAHPTSVPEKDHYAVSADFLGFYYAKLEELSGSGCVAMFLNGAEGDQTCANPEGKQGWDRTESIGRLLAIRVKEVANRVPCGEATLRIAAAAPTLPHTIGAGFMPDATTLKVLEVNGELLVSFLPGEPCVELGLELRRRALAQGYKYQFTVGLSNDHLLYFVPPDYYDKPYYETGMNFYGPFISNWLYREFSKLTARGVPEPGLPEPPAPLVRQIPGGKALSLSGDAFAVGYERGIAFSDTLHEAYKRDVLEPIESGAYIPSTGLWANAPPFLDLKPIALPALAISARPMLAGLSQSLWREIDGMAFAAGLPFDAVWLIHCSRAIAMRSKRDNQYRTPFCTMFAVVGDRAGADDVLVGRNFDWPDNDESLLFDVTPDAGHRFAAIGFPWTAGAFSGMNDAGLVLCVERIEELGPVSYDAAPIELVVRDILQNADSAAAALARFGEALALRGYSVLLADPDAEKARVVAFGSDIRVREPGDDGVLLGADPTSDRTNAHSAVRYGRLAALIEREAIVAPGEIQGMLQDSDSGQPDPARICNSRTRHSVVFEPKARRMHVAFGDGAGRIGPYTTLSLQDSGYD